MVQPFDPSLAASDAIETLAEFSENLAAINFNSTYSIVGSRAIFEATPNEDGLAVFWVESAASFFSDIGEFDFIFNDASSVLFNLFDDASSDYWIDSNFLANSAPTYGDRML